MNTGITSLAKLSEMGAVYPFAGMEWIFVIALAVFTILFFIAQIAIEHRHHKVIMSEAKPASPVAMGLAPAE